MIPMDYDVYTFNIFQYPIEECSGYIDWWGYILRDIFFWGHEWWEIDGLMGCIHQQMDKNGEFNGDDMLHSWEDWSVPN